MRRRRMRLQQKDPLSNGHWRSCTSTGVGNAHSPCCSRVDVDIHVVAIGRESIAHQCPASTDARAAGREGTR